MSESTETAKKGRSLAKKASSKQDSANEVADMMRLMKELHQDLIRAKDSGALEGKVVKRSEKDLVIRAFHGRFISICTRNNVTPVAAFPFVCKMARNYGLAALDDALSTADALCTVGSPEGMIHSQARVYWDDSGQDYDDAAYLDANNEERRILQGVLPSIEPSAVFVSELVRPYTHLRMTALSRLEYINIVRVFCLGHAGRYDFRRVLDYFEALLVADGDRHRLISGPDDVPTIDLQSLQLREDS